MCAGVRGGGEDQITGWAAKRKCHHLDKLYHFFSLTLSLRNEDDERAAVFTHLQDDYEEDGRQADDDDDGDGDSGGDDDKGNTTTNSNDPEIRQKNQQH